MHWLGLDIGGANIKVADGRDYAKSQSFALWQRPDNLGAELHRLIADSPACDSLAVTMTGELADCFASKADGVHHILDAVDQAAGDRPVGVYQTSGHFVPTSAARRRVKQVAAANWHAAARFVGRFSADGPALYIDLGSTTCDVIPLQNGLPVAAGSDDTTRLVNGELVYCGVRRTPLCGLVSHLPWRGAPCPVSREWFATTHDVYLLTLEVLEDPDDTDTADGQPATRDAARIRLARMICADPPSVTLEDATVMARAIAATQASVIGDAIRQVIARMGAPPTTVIIAGEGEFLARQSLARAELAADVISLRSVCGDPISRCAPAHAVAALAAEEAVR